jgi:hypothetical protein
MVFIKDLLTSNEIDMIKYGVYIVRKQMSVEKNEPSNIMIENHIPELLIKLLDEHLNDDSITVKIFNLV